MDAWQHLYTAAEQQHGAVAAWQAVRLGIAKATLYRHASRHCWVPLPPGGGVWALPGTPATYERRLAAARLGTVNRAPATGPTALWLMGALRRPPEDVHLWCPPRLHLVAAEGVRYHRGAWVFGDRIAPRGGFPCAPPLRALTDHSLRTSVAALEDLVGALDRLRLAVAGEAVAYIERRGRFPGIVKLRVALGGVAEELVHSHAERRARRTVRQARLPPPHRRPLAIQHRDVIVGEIDLPWPEVRYGVEVDGPHHLLPEVVAADKARDRRLGRLLWVIDRFTVDEIDRDPPEFIRQVRAGLEAARARGVPPWPFDGGSVPDTRRIHH